MHRLEEFKEFLSTPKTFVLITHQKPDADALGSSLAMTAYLKKKGHRTHLVSPTDYPEFLHWMSGNEDVVVYTDGNQELSAGLIDNCDAIMCLDFSCLDRIDELGEMVWKSDATKIVIDHHLEPDDFAYFEFWDTKAAATAEIVVELISNLGDRALIDKEMAESLYAGLVTDTGGFKNSNTTKKVHLITAELIDHGADVVKVGKLIYDNNTLNRLKFLGFALSERLTVLDEYKTAYFAISEKDLSRFKSQTGDTEGLVNYALSIKGIAMAAMIMDREDGVRLSFRSIGDFSVNEFAKSHFEGGGHKNAAGGISKLSLDETVEKFRSILKNYKAELNSSWVTTQVV